MASPIKTIASNGQAKKVANEILSSEVVFLKNIAGLDAFREYFGADANDKSSEIYKILDGMQKLAAAFLEKYPNGPDWLIIDDVKNSLSIDNVKFQQYMQDMQTLLALGGEFQSRGFAQSYAAQIKVGRDAGKVVEPTTYVEDVPMQVIQRAARYPLLLGELSKVLGEIEVVKPLVDHAKGIAANINDNMNQKSNAKKSLGSIIETADASAKKIKSEAEDQKKQTTEITPVDKAVAAATSIYVLNVKAKEATKNADNKVKISSDLRVKLTEAKAARDKDLDSEVDFINELKGKMEKLPYLQRRKAKELIELLGNNPSDIKEIKAAIVKLEVKVKYGRAKKMIAEYTAKVSDREKRLSTLESLEGTPERPGAAKVKQKESVAAREKENEAKKDLRSASSEFVEMMRNLTPEQRLDVYKKIEDNNVRNAALSTEIHDAIKNSEGKLDPEFIKEKWDLFVNGDFSKVFMDIIVPNLSDSQLFNFTQALMTAHLASGNNNDSMLRANGHLSGMLYKEMAKRTGYDPLTNPDNAVPEKMKILNDLVYQNVANIQQHTADQAQKRGGAGMTVATPEEYAKSVKMSAMSTVLFAFAPLDDDDKLKKYKDRVKTPKKDAVNEVKEEFDKGVDAFIKNNFESVVAPKLSDSGVTESLTDDVESSFGQDSDTHDLSGDSSYDDIEEMRDEDDLSADDIVKALGRYNENKMFEDYPEIKTAFDALKELSTDCHSSSNKTKQSISGEIDKMMGVIKTMVEHKADDTQILANLNAMINGPLASIQSNLAATYGLKSFKGKIDSLADAMQNAQTEYQAKHQHNLQERRENLRTAKTDLLSLQQLDEAAEQIRTKIYEVKQSSGHQFTPEQRQILLDLNEQNGKLADLSKELMKVYQGGEKPRDGLFSEVKSFCDTFEGVTLRELARLPEAMSPASGRAREADQFKNLAQKAKASNDPKYTSTPAAPTKNANDAASEQPEPETPRSPRGLRGGG